MSEFTPIVRPEFPLGTRVIGPYGTAGEIKHISMAPPFRYTIRCANGIEMRDLKPEELSLDVRKES
jgi:hypothetical protein